jgi:hypothetical protein
MHLVHICKLPYITRSNVDGANTESCEGKGSIKRVQALIHSREQQLLKTSINAFCAT